MTAVYGKHGGIFSDEATQDRTYMTPIYIEKLLCKMFDVVIYITQHAAVQCADISGS